MSETKIFTPENNEDSNEKELPPSLRCLKDLEGAIKKMTDLSRSEQRNIDRARALEILERIDLQLIRTSPRKYKIGLLLEDIPELGEVPLKKAMDLLESLGGNLELTENAKQAIEAFRIFLLDRFSPREINRLFSYISNDVRSQLPPDTISSMQFMTAVTDIIFRNELLSSSDCSLINFLKNERPRYKKEIENLYKQWKDSGLA